MSFDDLQYVQETDEFVDVDFYLDRSDGSELLIRVTRYKLEDDRIVVSPPRMARSKTAEFNLPDEALNTPDVTTAVAEAMPEIRKLLGL